MAIQQDTVRLLRRINPLRYRNRSFLSWHWKRFGVLPTISVSPRLLLSKDSIALRSRFTPQRFHLRPGTTDIYVFDEIFFAKEYELALGEPKFIIDAGAHIGCAAVYFSLRYPKATIVALEPEASNHAMLVANTAPFPNVHPLRAGLWSRSGHLNVHNPAGETWSAQVSEAPSGIPAVSVADLMRTFSMGTIDVLKIDIEGAEREVLDHSSAWLRNVRTLIIELHDRLVPGCSAALERALTGLDFERRRSGESWVLSRSG